MRWLELKKSRLSIVRSLLDHISNLLGKLSKTSEKAGQNRFENMFEYIVKNIVKYR